ncbi:MAG: hypothetical protein ABEL51_12535 [Salinibacter sp.]
MDLSSLYEWAVRLKERLEAWAETPVGRWTLTLLRHGVTLAVLVYLAYQMTRIGWGRIWASLPTTPWFYVLFLALYFLLPIFQSLGYSLIWNRPFRRLFPALLKSGVYNKEVLNYSGEMYLFSWARQRLALSDGQIAHHIKDNTIVSSVASTTNAVVLLGLFLASDLVRFPMLSDQTWIYMVAGVIGIIALIAVGVRFRRSVFKLSGRLILALFALYFGRLLLLQGLQVTQWAVALPEVALQTWFTFLAVQIITKRIPLMPSQDLFFMAVGLKMAGAVQVPEAGLASVLAINSVLDKGVGLLLFAAVSWYDRQLSLSSLSSSNGSSPELDDLSESDSAPDPEYQGVSS